MNNHNVAWSIVYDMADEIVINFRGYSDGAYCIFCGYDCYKSIQHAPDCIVIQAQAIVEQGLQTMNEPYKYQIGQRIEWRRLYPLMAGAGVIIRRELDFGSPQYPIYEIENSPGFSLWIDERHIVEAVFDE